LTFILFRVKLVSGAKKKILTFYLWGIQPPKNSKSQCTLSRQAARCFYFISRKENQY